MSFRKMVNKIKHIILGTYYNITNKHTDVAYPRLMICAKCEHNKTLLGFGNYCNVCGCILKSKASVKDEHCNLKKW